MDELYIHVMNEYETEYDLILSYECVPTFYCPSYSWVSILWLSAYFMAECLFHVRVPILWLSVYSMAKCLLYG